MSQDQENELHFKPFYWNCYDDENQQSVIDTCGLTSDNKSVFIKIYGYLPYSYLILNDYKEIKPDNYRENQDVCKNIKGAMNYKSTVDLLVKAEVVKKKLIYHSEEVYAIKLYFRNTKIMRTKANNFNRFPLKIFSKQYSVKLLESKIDNLIKFTVQKDLPLADWITVKTNNKYVLNFEKKLPESMRKFTTTDHSFRIKINDISRYNGTKLISSDPSFVSFDIETNSDRLDAKDPDASVLGNHVFQISCIYGRLNQPNHKKYLLTLFNPLDISGVEVIRFNNPELTTLENEAELIIGFKDLMNKLNPDCYIGYNIMKFDWNYMIRRAELTGILNHFLDFSREIDSENGCKIETKTWSSSAYGKQSFDYISCKGTINVDVMLEVERNYKLPKYTLEYVSQQFLGTGKDKITAKQLFILFKITQVMTDSYVQNKTLDELKKNVRQIMLPRHLGPLTKDFKNDLLSSQTKKDFIHKVRKALTLTGKYCVKDTELPIKLVEKLNLWISMEQMSNVTGVPMAYLHTRGQQIKVMSQLYKEAQLEDIIISEQEEKEDENFQGAYVVTPKAGFHDFVSTFDFGSLYPTVDICLNLCPTTILPPNVKPKEGEEHLYNKCAWEDHVKCEHDPLKRKPRKDKKDVICEAHEYYYKKTDYDDEGNILHQGLLPKMLKNLLQSRKQVKNQLKKAELKLKMQTGKIEIKDLEKIPEKDRIKVGSLTPLEEKLLKVDIGVLDAQQLALKVSANSGYGFFGAENGMAPHKPTASTITFYGRMFNEYSFTKITSTFPDTELVYGDTDSCMIKMKNRNFKECFKLSDKIPDIVQNYVKTKVMGIDENYSVKIDEKNVHIKDVKKENCHLIKDLNERKNVFRYLDLNIVLEFEKLYGKYLLVSKKRYVGEIINEDGIIIKEEAKGVVLARRDNCSLLREIYTIMKNKIIKEGYREELKSYFEDLLSQLFCRSNFLVKTKCCKNLVDGKHVHNFTPVKECNEICEIEHSEFEIDEKHVCNFSSIEECEETCEVVHSKNKINGIHQCDEMCKFSPYLKHSSFKINGKHICHSKPIKKSLINCKFIKHSTFKIDGEHVCNFTPVKQSFDCCVNRYDDKQFIIYKSVKDLRDYAVKVPAGNDKMVWKSKDGSYFDDATDCLDPRLWYDRILPQVLFCQKLTRRGVKVPARTRLEFVYTKSQNEPKDIKNGEKMEDYTYYKENHKWENFKIDLPFYLEIQLSKPVKQLIELVDEDTKYGYFVKNEDVISSYIDKTNDEKIKELFSLFFIKKKNMNKIKDLINDKYLKDNHKFLHEQIKCYFAKEIMKKLIEQKKTKSLNLFSSIYTRDNLQLNRIVKVIDYNGKECKIGKVIEVTDPKDKKNFKIKVEFKDGKFHWYPRADLAVSYIKDDNYLDHIIFYRNCHEKVIEEIKQLFKINYTLKFN